jgi:hypothetical protein
VIAVDRSPQLRKGRERMKPPIRSISSGILLLLVATSSVWAMDKPQFAVKESRRDSSGVTFQTSVGVMRVEVCGDRVIHVVASRSSEIPHPKVPIVTQQCQPTNFQVNVGRQEVQLSTAAIIDHRRRRNRCVEFFIQRRKDVVVRTEGRRQSLRRAVCV